MEKVRMGIGFGGWRLGTPSAATMFELIDKAEQWGIDSIWLSDHILDSGAHPELDTPTMLAAIAARTTRLKMGPSVLLVPLRHPVIVAKIFATLDYLAPGRVICAVGLGANPKEFDILGMTIEHRAGKLDEGIVLMRKLWSESHVTFNGKYYRLEDVTIEPKPARRNIHLWVGGRSEFALKRVARLADGWFASRVTPQQFQEGRQKSAECARAYGRAAADIEAGLTKFVLWPACPPADLIEQVDRFAHRLIPEFSAV